MKTLSYEERLHRVLRHIENNLGSRPDLAELAEIACFSPYHFHRIFSSMMGESVATYVRRLLLERAAQQLSLIHIFINWGMLPFITDADLAATLKVGDWLAVPNVRKAVQNAEPTILAYVVRENGSAEQVALTLKDLTDDERQIILDGCLINFYNSTRKQ